MRKRILPGMKRSAMYDWGPSESWGPPDDAHKPWDEWVRLSYNVRQDPLSVTRSLQTPEGYSEATWCYEYSTVLMAHLGAFVTALSEECTKETCPQMNSNETTFLCACHKQPQHCPAVEYAAHMLDGATAVLCAAKYLNGAKTDSTSKPSAVFEPSDMTQLFTNILRRLYRILSHAYYHHRAIFDACENEFAVCERFVRFGFTFGLISDKRILIIPIPAELVDIQSPSAKRTSAITAERPDEPFPAPPGKMTEGLTGRRFSRSRKGALPVPQQDTPNRRKTVPGGDCPVPTPLTISTQNNEDGTTAHSGDIVLEYAGDDLSTGTVDSD